MPVKRTTPKTSKRSSNCATVGPAAHGCREPKAKTAEFTKRSHSKKTATKNQEDYRPEKTRKKPWDGLQHQKNRRFLKVLLKTTMRPLKESILNASVGPVAHDWREPKAKTAEFTKRSHSKKLQRKTRLSKEHGKSAKIIVVNCK